MERRGRKRIAPSLRTTPLTIGIEYQTYTWFIEHAQELGTTPSKLGAKIIRDYRSNTLPAPTIKQKEILKIANRMKKRNDQTFKKNEEDANRLRELKK